MTMVERVRRAIDDRLARIERALRAIEGVVVERGDDSLHVRGRGLLRRSIEDVRLRFLGRSQ